MEQTTSQGSWWLRLTAPPGAANYDQVSSDPREREYLRRAGLTSIIAPFIFIAPLLLLQQAADFGILAATAGLMLIVVIALILNRTGKQVPAALLLVLAMDGAIEGALLSAGTLASGWLLTFDLLAIPLVAVAVLLSRRFLWAFMILHIAFILGDFFLLPHAKDLNDLIILWHGPAIAFARPVIVQIGLALLSNLSVRSTDQAISRANRAEEVAVLEHEIANSKQQLERDAQILREALAQIASGNFKVRAQVPQGTVLWDIASSINNMLLRFERYGMSEYELNRTKKEAQHLASALDDLAGGRPPLWPARTGTLLDPIIERLALLTGSAPNRSHEQKPNATVTSYPPSPHNQRRNQP
jgi:hypothetical protein